MSKEEFFAGANKVLAFVFVGLFCWILWPIKWTRKLVLKTRIHNAEEEAKRLSLSRHKAVYVVQNGNEVAVGTREELREWNKQQKKLHPEFLDIDYRHAVIFRAINGKDYTIR